jgi:chitosanase
MISIILEKKVFILKNFLVVASIILCLVLFQNFTKLFAVGQENSNEKTIIEYNPYENLQTENWLKGCTHSHTTESDGENTVEEMAKEFKLNNFDFAFITDHGKITGKNCEIDDVLILKGEEMQTSIEEYNAFFINDPLDDTSENDAVLTINEIINQGGFCQLNHPMRRDIDKEEILELAKNGLWGIEILNSGDDLVPLSTWDYILSEGFHLWGTFGADAHDADDVNNGWIMVNSKDSTVESISESMKSGNFYCSTGPIIDNIEIEDNIIKVTSQENKIKWYSNNNELVGEGNSYEINGTETYVRAVIGDECEDFAITQPIFINGINEVPKENNEHEGKISIKTTIQQITSIFENSTTELEYTYCENIDDGRGLTFGFAGFCSGTYDGTMFLKEYKKLNPENKLIKYIPIFENIDNIDEKDNTEGLEDFAEDFASCIDDSRFIEAQINLCDRLYWNPSQEAVNEIGAKYPITKGQLYDAFINHGENGARDLMEEATDNVGGTPDSGVDEKEWLSCFLNARLQVLEEDSTWKEAIDRIFVYQKLLDDNNYYLTRPIEITCYGDDFILEKNDFEVIIDDQNEVSIDVSEKQENKINISTEKNLSENSKNSLPITGENDKNKFLIFGFSITIMGLYFMVTKFKP